MELLTCNALTWATVVWEQGGELISSHEQFTELFWCVFDHSLEGRKTGEQLLPITQGTRRVAEYALEFLTIAVRIGWNDPALKAASRLVLNLVVLTE